jgi:hypothetical protein
MRRKLVLLDIISDRSPRKRWRAQAIQAAPPPLRLQKGAPAMMHAAWNEVGGGGVSMGGEVSVVKHQAKSDLTHINALFGVLSIWRRSKLTLFLG